MTLDEDLHKIREILVLSVVKRTMTCMSKAKRLPDSSRSPPPPGGLEITRLSMRPVRSVQKQLGFKHVCGSVMNEQDSLIKHLPLLVW